jgi:DNA-binding CsgD family transcriptional regulator
MAEPSAVEAPDPLRYARLSKRELEVLEMTSTGLTNTDIADGLQLSVHAVKFHLASIYRKLGVANRTEAAVAYMRSRTATDDQGGG